VQRSNSSASWTTFSLPDFSHLAPVSSPDRLRKALSPAGPTGFSDSVWPIPFVASICPARCEGHAAQSRRVFASLESRFGTPCRDIRERVRVESGCLGRCVARTERATGVVARAYGAVCAHGRSAVRAGHGECLSGNVERMAGKQTAQANSFEGFRSQSGRALTCISRDLILPNFARSGHASAHHASSWRHPFHPFCSLA
jgi:hypothetical protein